MAASPSGQRAMESPERIDLTRTPSPQPQPAASAAPASTDPGPSSDEAEPEARPAKRARLDSSAAAGPSSADQTGSVMDSAAFALLRVRGLADRVNRGMLGIRLRDVVCGDLRFALVSNFMVDMGWLLSACPDLRSAGRLMVVHGERSPHRAEAIRAAAAETGLADCLVHCPPLPIAFGTYHSKAFLLEYGRGVRVVVHTANLIYVDCNNKTQGLWYQDFPKKEAGSATSSPFEDSLAAYLAALRLPAAAAQHVQQLCRDHDFSSARAHLVPSCPGYHSGAVLHRYGHMRVRALLNRERFPPAFRAAPLAAQFSSLGSLDAKWLLQELQASLAAGGLAGAPGGALGERLGLPSPGGAAGLQLVWPTVEEIRNSIEGWAAGASVPGPSKNVTKPFLQPFWHRYGGEVAGRQRAMPHIKTYCRYRGQQLAWMLLASHNLSKAAWGSLQKQGQQLFIRSYELGVLLIPSLEAQYLRHRHRGFSCTELPDGYESAGVPALPPPQACGTATPPIVEFWSLEEGAGSGEAEGADKESSVTRLTVPLPYRLPPPAYSPADRPWTVDEPHAGLDSLGAAIHDQHRSFYGRIQEDD